MRIAITGGSGALGHALISRLTHDGTDRIVTLTRDEQRRAQLHAEFGGYPGFRVYAGDIRDKDRLVDIFGGVEIIIHAAARKVVNGAPDEVEEIFHTNLVGTRNVIAAARLAGVQKLIFISSDKACHAESQAYGLSKAFAEKLVVAANAVTFSRGLRLSVLRYGNVLASTGSVIVRWREQITRGEPIAVSDERMTRFWLSVDQAVEHVLTAIRIMKGGEVMVPHVPAAPLMRLAQALSPDGSEPRVVISGIRSGGEKIHEQLLSADETRRARRWQGMYVVPPDIPPDARWDTSPWLGECVPEDLLYRSDVWEYQAMVEDLRRLLR